MEAISEVTTSRTLHELENYFSSYGDLPREIILKHDLLRVGHWLVHGRGARIGFPVAGEILSALFIRFDADEGYETERAS
jgi:hypothetical protein